MPFQKKRLIFCQNLHVHLTSLEIVTTSFKLYYEYMDYMAQELTLPTNVVIKPSDERLQ
jgi:hypothetical protein